MTPEVLLGLETLPAGALKGPRGRVDALVETHRGRVLEALAAYIALARVVGVVAI